MRGAKLLIGLALLMSMAAQGQTANLNAAHDRQIAERMNDFGGLERYRVANLPLAPPAKDEDRVVFFGDSITAGWNLDQSFPGKGYINRGIGGQTTSQMLLRFHQDVIGLKPKAVVILAGINDIAGITGPISPEEIEVNFATMAELAKVHGIQVVFASLTPVGDEAAVAKQRPWAEVLELNRWLKGYCAREGLVYLDYFDVMVDGQGKVRHGLAQDGLHPNEAGHEIMAPLAGAAIAKALAEKRDLPDRAGSPPRS